VHEVHLSEGIILRSLQTGWPCITGVSDIETVKALLARLTQFAQPFSRLNGLLSS
jgi:hypothetical protein